MSDEKKIIIHLQAFILDKKMMMAEVQVQGDGSDLGGLLEGAMNYNALLASIIIGAAIFHCDKKGLDLNKYAEMYRRTYKKQK
jgi:hypothetical protein